MIILIPLIKMFYNDSEIVILNIIEIIAVMINTQIIRFFIVFQTSSVNILFEPK